MEAEEPKTVFDEKAKMCLEYEDKYGCHNYHPIEVVLARGEGVYVWDTAGKRYFDFLAAYSAVNQGHCHPKIIAAMNEQAKKLTLCSRAFFSDNLGIFEKKLCEIFGYDKALLMNAGVEAVESGMKIAKRWGYYVKKIPMNKAKVVFMVGNFWGRTYAACATSEDPDRYEGFGPYPGEDFFKLIEYNDAKELEDYLKNEPNVCAVIMEPIQGERGIMIPDKGYLPKVREICTKYNVLMCCDEIQSGIGRTGKLLAVNHENVRPDMIFLGKALSGGMYPISAVLCDNAAMLTITPGSHGSTYGGNSLACAIGIAAMDALFDEKMVENSAAMGEILLEKLKELKQDYIKTVRGRGLFCAIEFYEKGHPKHRDAYQFCYKLRDYGLLAKPTHDNIVRLSPPLVITKEQVLEAAAIIKKVAEKLQ